MNVTLHKMPHRTYDLIVQDGRVRDCRLVEMDGRPVDHQIRFDERTPMIDAYASLIPEVSKGLVVTLSGHLLPTDANYEERIDWLCTAMGCSELEADRELSQYLEQDDYWMVRFRSGDWATQWHAAASIEDAAASAVMDIEEQHVAVRKLGTLVGLSKGDAK